MVVVEAAYNIGDVQKTISLKDLFPRNRDGDQEANLIWIINNWGQTYSKSNKSLHLQITLLLAVG